MGQDQGRSGMASRGLGLVFFSAWFIMTGGERFGRMPLFGYAHEEVP